MPAGVSNRQQRGMGEKQGSDHKTEAPMQPIQAVASHRRLDPGQTADEDQLKEYARGDQEPHQPAERHRAAACFAVQQQTTRAMPPRDAKRGRMKRAGHSEPLRRRDGARAVPSQDSFVKLPSAV